ncbi:PREDICTED: uncharacterized protein LOC109473929 [Branchiostoma belcheri]|uniref:Uncharacterized protein LOC109473929 n=1 Tax=Branchiostoma belcheri TaxID=7741 RepID=A0A6P4YZC9_BRABE|nr:PREDICTED: uncharacterized protein LOC109473929 [Branchiostoma belcheri]XP_019629657.1 PREDICTED: uncharacterized protein LOC109473929 [Branchiostoma belcheri]XP_019629658.1 PREDICTED: uncharacterized protein LOC109473929 [Branchiostoma belcheri]
MLKDLLREFDEVVSDDDEEEEEEEENDDDKRSRNLPPDWNPADYKCWIDPRENKRNAEKKEEDPPKTRNHYREDVQVKREGNEFRAKLSSLLDNGVTRKETSSPISWYNSVDTARPSRVMCLRQDESERRSSSLDRYTGRPASPIYTANNRPASPARYTINTRPTSPATIALERARSLLNKIELKTSTAGSLTLSRARRYDDRRYASLRIPTTSRRLQPAYMSISLSR